MRRSLLAAALLLSGSLLAGCDANSTFLNNNLNCDRVRTYDIGNTVNGSLTSSDCQLSDGSAADYYEIRVNSSRQVQIVAQSNQFDPYLAILDSNGNSVQEETFGDVGYSEIVTSLPSGTYYVTATSYNPGDQGSYQLTSDYY
ncbi:MAG TPA: hypothetical protein VFE05_02050 [Longimicrobiaceae bacterium]|jgi:hypothetical protein|nr:hypothetical protein [Longimicrobiaceae bacterium]